jgi:uroporphyrinogen-III synthase
MTRIEHEGGRRVDLEGVRVACIGQTTAAAAAHHQLRSCVTAADQTMAGLVGVLTSPP